MESLKELIQLEQTRINLTGSLQGVLERIERLQSDLIHSARPVPLPFNAGNVSQPNKAPQGGGNLRTRMGRGELRNRIVDILRRAGSRGARVCEIAEVLGMKPVNIHSWFHTATQRIPELKRFGPGRYRLEGGLDSDLAASDSVAKVRRKRSAKQSARNKRGEVSRRILEVLENADADGIKVAEIAEKVGADYRNVHVWLSSADYPRRQGPVPNDPRSAPTAGGDEVKGRDSLDRFQTICV
jgi:predicted transcriptional regulator with HTH domain